MAEHFRKILALACFSLLIVAGSEAAKPGPSLREASRYYQTKNYTQAIQIAGKSLEYSKNDVDAMLIMAMSYFNSHNYTEAKAWFRRIIQLKPAHPVAKEYIQLIRELEHRFGPFKSDMTVEMQSKDPVISGEGFKRAWFGHTFPEESQPLHSRTDTKEPSSKQSVSINASETVAEIALDVEPPLEKVLAEKTVASMAQEALKSKMFLKSYLFFSQLAAHNPDNRSYIIGKAESAFHMKRYDEVIKALGPIMLASDKKGFKKDEYKAAQKLLDAARKKLYE